MDGKPLANALVVFSPVAGGRSSTGKTDAGGKYELSFIEGKGALLGSHKVSVTTLQEAAQAVVEVSSDDPAYAQQGSAADYEKALVKETIPARYNTETELTKDVTAGSNTMDLELTSS
jgi:FlaG/FlaF family flagellin (archaellin)